MKKLFHTLSIGLALAGLALLAACASTPYSGTRLIDVQPNQEKPAKPPYQAPVVGVLIDSPARGALEKAIVSQLRERGIRARAAQPIFGDKGTAGKSRAYLAGRLRDNGFDSAVGIHLLDKKIQKLQAGGGPSAPVPAGAGMSMRPEPLGPNFSLDDTTYVAKINFWDVRQQAIVWSATSLTHNPNGIRKGSTAFAKVVVTQLMQAGLFN